MRTAGAILILLSAAGAGYFHFVLERAAYVKDADGYYPEIYGPVDNFRLPVYLMAAALTLFGVTVFCLGHFREREKRGRD